MKYTYTLYSAEQPEGKELAVLHDMQQANILEPYFWQVYNNSAFKVTYRYPRQKEKWLTGSYND